MSVHFRRRFYGIAGRMFLLGISYILTMLPLWTNGLRLYSRMISLGIIVIGTIMYSYFMSKILWLQNSHFYNYGKLHVNWLR